MSKEPNDEKRQKPKRAEIQIYRPGALRQLKEAAAKSEKVILDENKGISNKVKKVENTYDENLKSNVRESKSGQKSTCDNVEQEKKDGRSTKFSKSKNYDSEYQTSGRTFHNSSKMKINNSSLSEKNCTDYEFSVSWQKKMKNSSSPNLIKENPRQSSERNKLSEKSVETSIKDKRFRSYSKRNDSKEDSNEFGSQKRKPQLFSDKDGNQPLPSAIEKQSVKSLKNLVLDANLQENNCKVSHSSASKFDKKKLRIDSYRDSSNKETNFKNVEKNKSKGYKYSDLEKVSNNREVVNSNSATLNKSHPKNKKQNKVTGTCINDKEPSLRMINKPKNYDVEKKHISNIASSSRSKNDSSDRNIKLNSQIEMCNRPTQKLDSASLISELTLSSEEASKSESSDDEFHATKAGVSCYVNFPETSFYNKTTSRSDSKHQTNNVSWGDEKWSPAQRHSREKARAMNEKENFSDSQRGIISLSKTVTGTGSSIENHNNESTLKGQKLLFNPNNPSKPVPVVPSARDLPSGMVNNYCNNESPLEEENQSAGLNLFDCGPSNGGGKIDPSIFYNIQKGEMDVNYYVSSNQLPQEFRRIMDIREHLKKCYRHLMLTDIRLCQEKNIDNALWKSLYYVIIEKLREYINREPTLKDRSQSTLLIIIDEGLEYLQSLLNDLQATYQFSLNAHCEEDSIVFPGVKNRVRLALYSCQKILLCMGDLARYREQHSQIPNYNAAKKWYEKALEVHPRNGRPFNQLAIIAVSQKRPLDVVYYYIRSLTAANPFTSARDSLITMFEEIRRKYNIMEKLPNGCNKSSQPKEEDTHSLRGREGSLRREIWIRPDNGITNKRTLSQSEEDKDVAFEQFNKLSHDQLMKYFLTSYLHCHGMLFSRVGLDHFNDVLIGTLQIFQYLLKLHPQRLSSTHLLQIMAVNMFAVDNTQLRDTRLENGLRSAAQDLALLLSQEMFGRIAEAMVRLFPKNLNYEDKTLECTSMDHNNGLFLPQLAHYVPAAKIWCDWLLYHSSVWNPPPVSNDTVGLDSWAAVAELATLVKGLGPPDIHLQETLNGPEKDLVPVVLPEDSFLRGYAPLLSAHRSSCFVSSTSFMERARDWVRLNKLQLCLSQFLCGVEPPILRLQKTDQGDILVPIVSITPPDSPSVSRGSLSGSEDLEESSSECESEEDVSATLGVEDTAPLASAVRLLAMRKKLLEKKQRQQRRMQALVEGSVTLEMEVCPRYLVPDTNCFIEHLPIIEALEKKKSYRIMVPLIVLGELDGLSRDTDVEKYQDSSHAIKVREGAATAFHYVTGTKHQQLKCVTSQGSILSSTMFTAEIDNSKNLTNDDKILACCLHLCDTNSRRPNQEGVRRLYREVVLLTEDRNLRVKAYARDVPVRDLLDFSHWAGIK